MFVSRRDILDHIGARTTEAFDEPPSEELVPLLSAVLSEQELPNVDTLVAFCADPGNLATYVQDPATRLAIADRLARRLIEFKRSGYGLPAEVFVG